MTKTIFVEAVRGHLCPVPGTTGRFYGVRRARDDDPESAIVHRVPDGRSYAHAGPVSVPNSQYVRKMLAQGALVPAKQDAPAAAPAGSGPGGSPSGDDGAGSVPTTGKGSKGKK